MIRYTEYEGLEITADSAVALRTYKTAMLVPNNIDAHGGKGGSGPPCVLQTSEHTIKAMAGNYGAVCS